MFSFVWVAIKYFKINLTSPLCRFTAVVLKTLCQARDIVYVDEEFVNAGFLWLLDHVNDDDTMEETDPIYDRVWT